MQDYVRKMNHVNRLGLMQTSRPYSIAEHGFQTAMLFLEVCREERLLVSAEELEAVMLHDIVETVTGDLPYPVKNHSPEVRDKWEQIEQTFVAERIPELIGYTDTGLRAQLDEDKHRIFKACDLLELMIFCTEEMERGNRTREMMEVWRTCMRILDVKGQYSSVSKYVDSLARRI